MQEKKHDPVLRDGKGKPAMFKVTEQKKYRTSAEVQQTPQVKPMPPVNGDWLKKISLQPTDQDLDRFLNCVVEHLNVAKGIAHKRCPFFVKINSGAAKSTYGICIGKYYNMREVWHYRVLTFSQNAKDASLDAVRTNDYEAYVLTPVEDDILTDHQRGMLAKIRKLDRTINPKPGEVDQF